MVRECVCEVVTGLDRGWQQSFFPGNVTSKKSKRVTKKGRRSKCGNPSPNYRPSRKRGEHDERKERREKGRGSDGKKRQDLAIISKE